MTGTGPTAWLRLHRTVGLGARGAAQLLAVAGNPEAALAASSATLAQAGLPAERRQALDAACQLNVDEDLAWADEHNHHLIPIIDARYPAALREIHDPPLLLYAIGDCELLRYPQLAIVGTRHPSPNGREAAFEFARHLATTGLGIASGLALGIDGAAHEGALAADGVTVAVAATGLDRVYPSVHRDLARRIAHAGILISEAPLGTRVTRGSFPRRNRIISGISQGVLVVEAARQSGSLITARLAGEQGREVFAIPGSIHNPMARGCHQLIREGAKLVETADDILEELGLQLSAPRPNTRHPVTAQPTNGPHVELLDAMGYDPVSVDHLVGRCGLTPEAVSSMLLILELQGRVAAIDGGRYVRTPQGDRDNE
ncbi:DNA protecting protein DprA [Acidihalobacter yilgarnensis]|uniref:DNA protecting protein DprA n=1 Tax=Acidihalobacter yilgarnensis TaxID=2819280 RepID=A0A1D8IJX1_9GAMM|nr:DNA-processing protein DprA [Acidihalobacter yilgarnensis]AOU96724.1 DNA protecting protein DprA [Acidihalobacter yilgarnensis]